jgi:SAM-dependent methyltransferase
MAIPTPVPVTPEAVKWAYRLFLDREPESDEVIKIKTQLPSLTALRNEFVASEEFRHRNVVAYRFGGYEPGMAIEEVSSEADLERLFAHIQQSWQRLGEEDPHWSVLTSEEFRTNHIHLSLDKFYASGRNSLERLLKTLARNEIDYHKFESCLEYGCGLGRVTRWLADEFRSVIGYEISQAHLRRAKQYLEQERVTNVTLCHLRSGQDINALPQVDLIYSILVLQHNPPPLIRVILTQFMRSLKKGGAAVFQVPTYREGYHFALDEYLSTRPAAAQMELHVLPQRVIAEIAERENARIVEVFEDVSVGPFSGVSNSFVVQKN